MNREQSTILEDYGTKPVPKGMGSHWIKIASVYLAAAICLPAFIISGLISGSLKLSTSIYAFFIASVGLGILAVLTGVIGAETKLSTGMTSRFTFGKLGANILQVLLFFALWGWFGVQLGFMVSGLGDGGLVKAIGDAAPVWLLKIIGGSLMVVTAIFGYRAIEKVSVISIPFLLVALLGSIFVIYGGDKTISSVANTGTGAMPFGSAISLLIGTFVVGSLISPDITRYAKSKMHGGLGMGLGMLIGFPFVLTLGAILAKGASGELDFSKILLSSDSAGWAFLCILAIVLAAWTTNGVNLYAGALSINALLPGVKKWKLTLASGVIGTGLALTGINTAAGFTTFLNLIAIFIPPAAAIVIADFYFFKGEWNFRYDPGSVDLLPKFRVLPLAVWAVSSLFGFITKYTPVEFTRVVALDTIIFAVVFYFLAMILSGKKVRVTTE